MRSPTRLGFIASGLLIVTMHFFSSFLHRFFWHDFGLATESPGKRHSSDQCTWSLPNKQNTPTCLRYTDDDVRFIFASVITGTLSPSVLTGTLSLKCTSALRICADEKTMYMNQLAKFCCILCRADAQRRLFGETLSWLAGDAFVTFHIVTSTEKQLVLFKIEHYLCTLCAPFFYPMHLCMFLQMDVSLAVVYF
jgi:hypothetical protein